MHGNFEWKSEVRPYFERIEQQNALFCVIYIQYIEFMPRYWLGAIKWTLEITDLVRLNEFIDFFALISIEMNRMNENKSKRLLWV